MDIDWIRKGLMRPGKSQRGLAKALGVDPAAVNRLLKNTRMLKAAEIEKVQAYLDAPVDLRVGPAEPHNDQPSFQQGTADRIKVLGMAECGPDGWALWNGEVVDTILRPSVLVGAPKGFAVYVVGTSMEDRYHPGELAYVHPGKPVTPGCYVLVQLHPKDGDTPRAVLKRLKKRSGGKVILEQLNPSKTFTLDEDEVECVYRVVGSGES